MLAGMPKRPPSKDAREFGERLVALLASKNQPRRGAGAYLSRRYKVSTVTANDWLNGVFKPDTTLARRIAKDHGATFDWLYFGDATASAAHPPEPDSQPSALDVPASQFGRPNPETMHEALELLAFDEEQAGRYSPRVRATRLCDLYARIAADGGIRLSEDSNARFEQEVRDREQGKHERVEGAARRRREAG